MMKLRKGHCSGVDIGQNSHLDVTTHPGGNFAIFGKYSASQGRPENADRKYGYGMSEQGESDLRVYSSANGGKLCECRVLNTDLKNRISC